MFTPPDPADRHRTRACRGRNIHPARRAAALLLAAGLGAGPASRPATVLIHLPGIAGEMPIDHSLVRGLVAGGVAPDASIYDWTGPDRGVPAITNVARHDAESRKVADKILAVLAADPDARVVLTGHSAGTGVAVQALERLPPGVHIDTLLLLASALSPDYDLTRALAHVRGRAVALHSRHDDIVLGTLTKTFGTYDRKYVAAAGLNGFTRPPAADPAAYAKLTQLPYDAAWAKLGHGGDHIGMTGTRFARTVLAPVLQGLPRPTTWPAGR